MTGVVHIGEAHDWVARIISALEYEVAYRERRHACDCNAAAHMRKMPGAELVEIGPWRATVADGLAR